MAFTYLVWLDVDTWFECQQQEEKMQRLQAENKASMQFAEGSAQKAKGSRT